MQNEREKKQKKWTVPHWPVGQSQATIINNYNVNVIRVQEVRGRGQEIFEKIMADHFPDLIKTRDPHIQEAQLRR